MNGIIRLVAVLLLVSCGARAGEDATESAPAPGQVAAPATSAVETVPPEQVEADRAHRAGLRAFYTAPPVIPHDTEGLRNQDCQGCHENNSPEPSDQTPLGTPHFQRTNCLQCHLASEPWTGGTVTPVASDWVGLEQPNEGRRAHEAAPPTIPHRVRMRENCSLCHGPESLYESLQTPHPERTSCQQCHLPDAASRFEITRGDLEK